jgi:hypothetical protein
MYLLKVGSIHSHVFELAQIACNIATLVFPLVAQKIKIFITKRF